MIGNHRTLKIDFRKRAKNLNILTKEILLKAKESRAKVSIRMMNMRMMKSHPMKKKRKKNNKVSPSLNQANMVVKINIHPITIVNQMKKTMRSRMKITLTRKASHQRRPMRIRSLCFLLGTNKSRLYQYLT